MELVYGDFREVKIADACVNGEVSVINVNVIKFMWILIMSILVK